MSVQEGKVNNNSELLTRDEFLSKFKYNNKKTINHYPAISKKRWTNLYNLNKLKQFKLEEIRNYKKAQNDKEYARQCTFSPSLNKLPKYLNKSNEESKSINQKTPIKNLLNRQDAWLNKVNMKNENLRQSRNNQITNQCLFKPTLNTTVSVDKICLTNKTEDIVTDPESYLAYVARLKSQRQQATSQTERYNNRLGSGKGWKRGQLKLNNYDYTQHEYVTQRMTPKRSNLKIGLYKNPNEVLNKSMKKEKSNDYITGNTTPNIETYEDNILHTEHANYGNALNKLHQELFAIKLMKDE